MTNGFDILQERGFVRQIAAPERAHGETAGTTTHSDPVERARQLLSKPVTYYIGFDPTADSLHVGSLLPIMAMAHLQRAGHRPIAIIGGGTASVGDPSGKTEMRRMMSREEIDANGRGILAQLQRYVDFTDGKGVFLNNADWLLKLGYIDFLRDIGRHFRVNEMIKSEAYRMRLEREEGLSFIEFNYQLLQAYDFLALYRDHKCLLQLGGDDQWGNIVAGIDLVRKLEGAAAYGITWPLLQTARGEKMGKTADGAVWLSAERTSPYQFYQYWINTDDRDVAKFLAYFTFLPMEEVRRLAALQGADIRQAKEVLAFETTRLCHGEAEADKARAAAKAAFGGGGAGAGLENVPSSTVARARLSTGVSLVDLLAECGLTSSKSEARKLVEQGGASVNGTVIKDFKHLLTESAAPDGSLMLRAGKKRYHRVVVE